MNEATMLDPSVKQTPTIWGLSPLELHARFWASRGVQIVRPGERTEIVPHAELFLLMGAETLAIFRLASVLDTLSWLDPDLVSVRLTDPGRDAYTERVVTDPPGQSGRFVRFERIYRGADMRIARLGITHNREIAGVWQDALDERAAWNRLRALVKKPNRYAVKLRARLYDAAVPAEVARFCRDLVHHWPRPDATISRVRNVGEGLWADRDAAVQAGPGVRGPLWIGAGREISQGATAVGPAVVWDDPARKPVESEIEWLEVESLSSPIPRPPARTLPRKAKPRPFKRLFDIVFSIVALALTLPLYPFIALAIIIEDGLPVFFCHKRETMDRSGPPNSRQFACIKFRSMRNNAEQDKALLQGQNKADGPQFFIPKDPRLTRVGKLLRDLQLDELPQFINVLKGDMSVVGPRPSPFVENQYCPPWREARLSVRPGITGLWQISRTRRQGADFQEWIKYDIQYVERQSMWLDLWIIWQTVLLVVRKITRP